MSMAVSPVHFKRGPIVVVMGVCGCGKSTIGTRLALAEKLPFLDADDYHPKPNIDKMSAGIPLTDQDRWPWLSLFGDAMRKSAEEEGGVIAACSALKRTYRTHLIERVGLPMIFVLLDGNRDILFKRISARKEHYMPSALLDSQLAILEKPTADEPALRISVEQDVDTIIKEIKTTLVALSK